MKDSQKESLKKFERSELTLFEARILEEKGDLYKAKNLIVSKSK